jgi:hypothetical protein
MPVYNKDIVENVKNRKPKFAAGNGKEGGMLLVKC